MESTWSNSSTRRSCSALRGHSFTCPVAAQTCRYGGNKCHQEARKQHQLKKSHCVDQRASRDCPGCMGGILLTKKAARTSTNAMTSVDQHTAGPYIHSPSFQHIWSSDHHRQPSHLISSNFETRKPVQSNPPCLSHLTPAEELIQAIDKLNTKFERPHTAQLGYSELACVSGGQRAAAHSVLDAAVLSRGWDQALIRLRQGLIGHSLEVQTPFGMKTILYADWAASGRLLWQVFTSCPHWKHAVLHRLACAPFVLHLQPIRDEWGVNALSTCTVKLVQPPHLRFSITAQLAEFLPLAQSALRHFPPICRWSAS